MENCLLKHAAFLTAITKNKEVTSAEIEALLSFLEKNNDDPLVALCFKVAAVYDRFCQGCYESDNAVQLPNALRALFNDTSEINVAIKRGHELFMKALEETSVEVDLSVLADTEADYFMNEQDNFDRRLLTGVFRTPDNNLPFTPNGTWHIGIANPWPGGMSAEAEVLARMKKGAENTGIRLTMLSNFVLEFLYFKFVVFREKKSEETRGN